jgi:hypothetical protein
MEKVLAKVQKVFQTLCGEGLEHVQSYNRAPMKKHQKHNVK